MSKVEPLENVTSSTAPVGEPPPLEPGLAWKAAGSSQLVDDGFKDLVRAKSWKDSVEHIESWKDTGKRLAKHKRVRERHAHFLVSPALTSQLAEPKLRKEQDYGNQEHNLDVIKIVFVREQEGVTYVQQCKNLLYAWWHKNEYQKMSMAVNGVMQLARDNAGQFARVVKSEGRRCWWNEMNPITAETGVGMQSALTTSDLIRVFVFMAIVNMKVCGYRQENCKDIKMVKCCLEALSYPAPRGFTDFDEHAPPKDKFLSARQAVNEMFEKLTAEWEVPDGIPRMNPELPFLHPTWLIYCAPFLQLFPYLEEALILSMEDLTVERSFVCFLQDLSTCCHNQIMMVNMLQTKILGLLVTAAIALFNFLSQLVYEETQ